MKKMVKIVALPVMALSLAGCGEVMESTSNLIDAVTKTIEEEDKEVVQPVVQEQPQQQTATPPAVTQTTTAPATQTVTNTAPAPAKQTNIVERDNSSMTHVQVTAKDANVRAEPSLNAAVVTAGTLYQSFEYLHEKVKTPDGRTWYKVSHNGKTGYMSSAVGTLVNEATYADHYTNGGNTIIATESSANVRSEPSLNGKVVHTAKKGEEMYYTGEVVHASDGRTWYQVIVGNKTGFISDRVSSTSEDYYYGTDDTEFLITNAEGNVRSSPSINAGVIYTGKKGEALYYTGYYEKTSDGRTWYEVSIGGTYGYISGAVGHVQ